MMPPWKAEVIQPYCWVVMCRLADDGGRGDGQGLARQEIHQRPQHDQADGEPAKPMKRRMRPPVARRGGLVLVLQSQPLWRARLTGGAEMVTLTSKLAKTKKEQDNGGNVSRRDWMALAGRRRAPRCRLRAAARPPPGATRLTRWPGPRAWASAAASATARKFRCVVQRCRACATSTSTRMRHRGLENELKWVQLRPNPKEFTFYLADQIIEWARSQSHDGARPHLAVAEDRNGCPTG